METFTIAALAALAVVLGLAYAIYRFVRRLREYFDISREPSEIHGTFEIFRSWFQDKNARFEETRRLEWVHLREYQQNRSTPQPIYP